MPCLKSPDPVGALREVSGARGQPLDGDRLTSETDQTDRSCLRPTRRRRLIFTRVRPDSYNLDTRTPAGERRRRRRGRRGQERDGARKRREHGRQKGGHRTRTAGRGRKKGRDLGGHRERRTRYTAASETTAEENKSGAGVSGRLGEVGRWAVRRRRRLGSQSDDRLI